MLAGLGVTDMGENRDQEAAAKAAEVAAAGVDAALALRRAAAAQQGPVGGRATPTWCTRSTACGWRGRWTGAGAARDRPLDVLVQVSIDGDPAPGRRRCPARPTRAPGCGAVAEAVAGAEALRLAGLMAVAPLGWEPERAFARLAEVAAGVPDGPPGRDRDLRRDER